MTQGHLEPEAKKYVQDYFTDFARNSATDFKRAQVRQNTVNRRLGATLDSFAQQSDREDKRVKLQHALTRDFEAGHLNRLPPLTYIWSNPDHS